MKICHVLSSMSIGGMERMVSHLIGAQAEEGVEPYLFCTDSEGTIYDETVAIEKCCAERKSSFLVIDFGVVSKLTAFIKNNGIELIHAHNHLGAIYGSIASMMTKRPFIVTLHGQGVGYSKKAKTLERLLMKRAGAVVAVSDDAKDVIINESLAPASKVTVIKNGIAVPREFLTTDDTDTTDENVIVIGSVGRFAVEKNYSLLIRSFARVNKGLRAKIKEVEELSLNINEAASMSFDLCSARLVLVGDGSERTSMDALIDELGICDDVTVPGMQNVVDPWLADMDIFCLSSDTEGTSITLLEAASAGLPSVVTDVGGNAEIVEDGKTGIVVPAGDENALTKALLKLAGDPDLRKRMGDNARERIKKNYSIDHMTEEYTQIYKKVGKVGK